MNNFSHTLCRYPENRRTKEIYIHTKAHPKNKNKINNNSEKREQLRNNNNKNQMQVSLPSKDKTHSSRQFRIHSGR